MALSVALLLALAFLATASSTEAPQTTTILSVCTRDTEMLCKSDSPQLPDATDQCFFCDEASTECSYCRIGLQSSYMTVPFIGSLILLIIALFYVPGCCVFYCGRFCCDCWGGRRPNSNICLPPHGRFAPKGTAVARQGGAAGAAGAPVEARAVVVKPHRYSEAEVNFVRGCGMVLPIIIILAAIAIIIVSLQLSGIYDDWFDATFELIDEFSEDIGELRDGILNITKSTVTLHAKVNSSDFFLNAALDDMEAARDAVMLVRDTSGRPVRSWLNSVGLYTVLLGIALLVIAVPGALIAFFRVRAVLTYVIPAVAAIVLFGCALLAIPLTPGAYFISQTCELFGDLVDPPEGYVSPLDGMRSAWGTLSTNDMAYIDHGAVPTAILGAHCEIRGVACDMSIVHSCRPAGCGVPPNTTVTAAEAFRQINNLTLYSSIIIGVASNYSDCAAGKGMCNCALYSVPKEVEECGQLVALSKDVVSMRPAWEDVRSLMKKEVAPGAAWNWDAHLLRLSPFVDWCDSASSLTTVLTVALWVASVVGVAYVVVMWLGRKRFLTAAELRQTPDGVRGPTVVNIPMEVIPPTATEGGGAEAVDPKAVAVVI